MADIKKIIPYFILFTTYITLVLISCIRFPLYQEIDCDSSFLCNVKTIYRGNFRTSKKIQINKYAQIKINEVPHISERYYNTRFHKYEKADNVINHYKEYPEDIPNYVRVEKNPLYTEYFMQIYSNGECIEPLRLSICTDYSDDTECKEITAGIINNFKEYKDGSVLNFKQESVHDSNYDVNFGIYSILTFLGILIVRKIQNLPKITRTDKINDNYISTEDSKQNSFYKQVYDKMNH